jgi:hypothetical protein
MGQVDVISGGQFTLWSSGVAQPSSGTKSNVLGIPLRFGIFSCVSSVFDLARYPAVTAVRQYQTRARRWPCHLVASSRTIALRARFVAAHRLEELNSVRVRFEWSLRFHAEHGLAVRYRGWR